MAPNYRHTQPDEAPQAPPGRPRGLKRSLGPRILDQARMTRSPRVPLPPPLAFTRPRSDFERHPRRKGAVRVRAARTLASLAQAGAGAWAFRENEAFRTWAGQQSCTPGTTDIERPQIVVRVRVSPSADRGRSGFGPGMPASRPKPPRIPRKPTACPGCLLWRIACKSACFQAQEH
jgi:hypothetical protein